MSIWVDDRNNFIDMIKGNNLAAINAVPTEAHVRGQTVSKRGTGPYGYLFI